MRVSDLQRYLPRSASCDRQALLQGSKVCMASTGAGGYQSKGNPRHAPESIPTGGTRYVRMWFVDLEPDQRPRSPRGSIHAYSYGELAGCHRGWRGA